MRQNVLMSWKAGGAAGKTALLASLLMGGMLPAHADKLEGDYQVTLNSETQKSVSYHCNSLNVYLNSGASLSGDLECNSLSLSANGSRVAFEGKVARVDVPMINGGSKVYLHMLNIADLHVAIVNGRSAAYFKITHNAQIDLVNGESYLYVRGAEGMPAMPSVHINMVNGNSEVHWCGVSIRAGSADARLIEDCDW